MYVFTNSYYTKPRTSLAGSGVASSLPSGTYRAVVTAFAPEPPVGMTSAYSQDWLTVSV